jgi:hypothetical protein
MAKANMFDPRARAKRKQKQAIALGVLFVAIVAFTAPRYMKMLKGPESSTAPNSRLSSATGTSGTSGTTGTSTPDTGVALNAASTSGEALVVKADLAPAPLDGQLADFTLFDAKDPFVQRTLGGPRPNGLPSSSSPAGRTMVTASSAEAPAGVGEVTSGTGTPTSTSTTTAAPAAPSAATISVNGVQEVVSVKADFPAASPLFHLAKLGTKSAEISIAGGSLASGAPTVTLKQGKPLTLMNTADGTRFVLILVNTTASPSTAAVAATPTTPTATTP